MPRGQYARGKTTAAAITAPKSKASTSHGGAPAMAAASPGTLTLGKREMASLHSNLRKSTEANAAIAKLTGWPAGGTSAAA